MVIAVAMFGVLLFILPVRAQGVHGYSHSSYHTQFYSKLYDKEGASCCNQTDCQPTEHRLSNGKIEMQMDGPPFAMVRRHGAYLGTS